MGNLNFRMSEVSMVDINDLIDIGHRFSLIDEETEEKRLESEEHIEITDLEEYLNAKRKII